MADNCTITLTDQGIQGCGISVTDKGLTIGDHFYKGIDFQYGNGAHLFQQFSQISVGDDYMALLILFFAAGVGFCLSALFVGLLCFIVWKLAKLPVIIAQRRGLNWPDYTAWVSLAILIFFPIIGWLVILTLACILPPQRPAQF